MEISRHNVFEAALQKDVRATVRSAIRKALDCDAARDLRILRPGGKRYKRALITPQIMFRNHVAGTGEQGVTPNMHIGNRELIWEVQPSSRNEYGVKCRILRGAQIDPVVFRISAEVFIATREQTHFDSIDQSCETLMRRFVQVLSYQQD